MEGVKRNREKKPPFVAQSEKNPVSTRDFGVLIIERFVGLGAPWRLFRPLE